MPKTFSAPELQTLHNTKFFEVKAAATKKIEHLFAEVRDEIKEDILKNKIVFPKEVDAMHGKIFRGENYLGLPYLVLDYPKHFSKDSVFAFRTMFWWGNFFSFTLHLQGKALSERREELIQQIPSLKKKSIYVCINSDPWQYHYRKDNYLPIDKFTDRELRKLFTEKEFVKLSRKMPLKDYKNLRAFCREAFEILACSSFDKLRGIKR
jgi:hypothetical protein